MALFGGVILGLAGASLLSLSPWLGGLLMALGYGYTAFCVHEGTSRLDKSLYFAFSFVAFLGIMITIGEFLFNATTMQIIEAMADRTLLLISFALLPWALAFFKYLMSLRYPKSSYSP